MSRYVATLHRRRHTQTTDIVVVDVTIVAFEVVVHGRKARPEITAVRVHAPMHVHIAQIVIGIVRLAACATTAAVADLELFTRVRVSIVRRERLVAVCRDDRESLVEGLRVLPVLMTFERLQLVRRAQGEIGGCARVNLKQHSRGWVVVAGGDADASRELMAVSCFELHVASNLTEANSTGESVTFFSFSTPSIHVHVTTPHPFPL